MNAFETQPPEPVVDPPHRILTAAEWCALPEPPAEDTLVGPLLVRGNRLIIGAATGHGKTSAVLQLIKTAIEGGDFVGFEAAGTGGNALLLDLEMGERSIKRALARTGLACADWLDYVQIPAGLELEQGNGEHLAFLHGLLAAKPYDVVGLDPFYKAHGGDSNEERHVVDLMKRLDGLRATYGFALILPTHPRKRAQGITADLTLDDLFGSGAFARGAEVAVGIRRRSNGYAHLYFWKDRDGDLPVGQKWGLLYDEEHGFRRDPSDQKPHSRDRVRDWREENPDGTQAQAAAELGIVVRTVKTYWHGNDPAQEELNLDGESA